MAKADTTGKTKPNKPTSVKCSRAAGSNEVVISWGKASSAGSGAKKWTENTQVVRRVYQKDSKGKVSEYKGSPYTAHVSAGTTSFKHSITLSKWHPNADIRYDHIDIEVRSRNSAGYSDAATKTFTFHSVSAPESVDVEYDSSTGVVSATASVKDPSSDEKGGFRTRTDVWVERSVDGGAWKRVSGVGSQRLGESATTAAAAYDTHADSTTSKSVVFRAAAQNHGPAGASKVKYSTQTANKANLETGTVVVARPNTPVISGISQVRDASGAVRAAKVSVVTGADPATRPVDKVTLWRLRNYAVERTASEAALADGWEEAASSNWNTDGLEDAYADAAPTKAGTRTWYRVSCEHGNYSPVYSEPKTADWLRKERNPASVGAVSLDSLTARDDGASLKAVMSWPSLPRGVEISWGDDAEAWMSTGGAKTHDVESATGEISGSGATYNITGLEEGKTYFVRVRPWTVDDDGAKEYGNYSATLSCLAASTPKEIVLSAPPYVMRGDGARLSWRFTPGSEKSSSATSAKQSSASVKQTAWSVKVNGVSVASGSGAECSAVLPASALSGLASASVSVMVTTGGAWGESPAVGIAVVDAPSCAIGPVGPLAAQPLRLSVLTDCDDPVLSVSVQSSGCSEGTTGREPAQGDGEVVFGGSFRPGDGSWSEDGALALPSGIDFRDGVGYLVTARVRSERWGVSSEPAQAAFLVDWAHKAEPPQGRAVPDPSDMSCTVTLTAPPNAADGDVADVYRLTPDGERAIAEGVPFGVPVRDPWAPFSGVGEGADLRYRAVTRTADGDTAGTDDLGYELAGAGVRLDWDGKHLDLAYDVDVSDSWEKDFERAAHLDGSVSGGWNEAVLRSSSVQTSLLRFRSDGERALLADVARHAGPVMVRTQRGQAYEADVQVGDVAYEHGSASVRVSLSIQEVDPTGAFVAEAAGSGGE